MLQPSDFKITTLGPREVRSPLLLSRDPDDGKSKFVPDESRVLYRVTVANEADFDGSLSMERAGPRDSIYFDPKETCAAIVTCGGTSPGLNSVIRSIVLELHHHYKVAEIIGFKYGLRGINPQHGNDPVRITPEMVRRIHHEGGTVLGSSRGAEDESMIVDRLQELGINVLFCVGGDGTLRGAHAIWNEVERRGAKIAVVGIPKTIDNDIPFVYKTFGFDTAVGVVRAAIDGAHVEAVGAPNGIGIVRTMGRSAGFIAAHGTLASMEVNFCLVPEVPFDLDGECGLLNCVERRIRDRGHVVIVVAEGAGQEHFSDSTRDQDASGNVLHKDIGIFLRAKIKEHLDSRGIISNIKYIDPSYLIRSVPPNASDGIFCNDLARKAVHAAMAGKTDVVIGLWHGTYVHVPNQLVTGSDPRRIHPESFLWRSVVQATGQPSLRSPCGED